MGDSLLSGVSGLQAHQKMLDVAGDNLANVDTTSFKSSRVSFAQLLSGTLKEAQQPSAINGGTNPMQIGSGVTVSSVDRNMTQGSLTNTGQPLDMAIQGAGYFVLNDGQQDLYTRAGAFAVDADFYLVDPGTGNRVQRIGSQGVDEGFQAANSNDIRIPYDVALPATPTSTLSFTGNLSADESSPSTNILTSGMQYTKQGAVASGDTLLTSLDQASGIVAGDSIVITGTKRDGTAIAATTFNLLNANGTSKTVNDLTTAIAALYPDSTVSLSSGEIRLTDKLSGYSQTDLSLAMGATAKGTLQLPNYFSIESAGGQATKSTNVELYDSQGIAHETSIVYVRTDTPNTWDAVVASTTGDVSLTKRRIKGLNFLADGSYGGLGVATPTFQFVYGNDKANIRTVTLDLGTIGQYNGLSQFGGSSTVAPSGQDGYASGWLSSLSVSREGVLVGVFTNGIRKDLAALKLATFQNPAGMASLGNNYFSASANSGDPVPVKALSGGAGAVQGGALEKSNVDQATEFVNLIQAQNGYQANARTIKIANEMLQELTGLIR